MRKRAIRIKVHDEKNSDRVRVHHEKERWGESSQ